MAKPTLCINMDTLERLRDGQPWGTLAQQAGVSEGTISRVRHGHSQPGPEFIAAFLTNLPVRFDDLVTVVAA